MAPDLIESIIPGVDLPSITCVDSSRREMKCGVVPKWTHTVDENLVEAVSSKKDYTSMMHQGNEVSFFNLPNDIHDNILARLEYNDVFLAKTVCKLFKAHIEGEGFDTCRRNLHPREGLFTALHFSVCDDGIWRCVGYDLDAKAWKKLPPFAMLPRLDSKLFKDHIICAAGGFMCVYLSVINKAISSPAFLEKMVVFHPLMRRWIELPPLNHPRSPMLMHIVVSPAGDSFKVIVVGSTRGVDDKHLSKITEVFDSHTSKWTVTEELPGPLFALNEHQTGAYKDGIVYCIAFLVEDCGRGLLAYNVEEGKWLSLLACPLPTSQNFNTLQVENINGEIVVFSEIEYNLYNAHRTVEHRIDVLEFMMHTNVGLGRMPRWRNVLIEWKLGSHVGLQVYPEYTCVPFGEGKMCIFNTITHTGDIYDMQSGKHSGKLSSPTWNRSGELNFYKCNPITFSFEPSFKSNLKLEHNWIERVTLA